MNSQILALDFDGTIIDSLDEVVLVTYCLLTDEAHLQLPLEGQSFARLFKANRFHVQPAGDFKLLGEWCFEQLKRHDKELHILSAAAFANLTSNESTERMRTAEFFAKRNEIAALDPAQWASLNSPYQPLWQTLQTNADKFFILTNKNQKAVFDLTRFWNLHMSVDQIYAGDGGASKAENLEKIIDRTGCSSVTFVDDSLLNLAEIGNLFKTQSGLDIYVDLLLAKWGYIAPDTDNTIKKIEKAGNIHIKTITQMELIGFLKETQLLNAK